MTNKEALIAQFGYEVKPETIQVVLENNGLTVEGNYSIANKKQIDFSLADLILFVSTNPKSVSDLDYTFTSQSIKDLLSLRSLILGNYTEPDPGGITGERSVIQDATNSW